MGMVKQKGFIIPPQVYVLLTIVVIGGGAVFAYNHAISKAERMEQERNAAVQLAEQREEQIFIEREQIAFAQAARVEAEKEMAAARERVTELEGLFSRHDLDDLLQKKPGLILNRANTATQQLQRDLEAAAAD